MFLFQFLRLLHLLLTCISLGTIPRQEFAQNSDGCFDVHLKLFFAYLKKMKLKDSKRGLGVASSAIHFRIYGNTIRAVGSRALKAPPKHHFRETFRVETVAWCYKSHQSLKPNAETNASAEVSHPGSLLKTGGPVTTLRDLRMLGSSLIFA